METVASLAHRILEPLCDATAKFLSPVRLQPHDRLDVKLDDDGTHFIIQIYARLNGQAVSASHIAREKWPTRIPERKHLGGTRWEIGATDLSALVINATWPEDQVEWAPDAKAVYNFLLQRFLSQTLASQHRARFKLESVVPEMPADWHDHPDHPLAKYQQCAVLTTLDQECSAYFMEQGTGKTPTVIRRVCIKARRHKNAGNKRPYTVLILSPKNVRQNWQNEFGQFATTPGKCTVLRGGQVERAQLILETISPDEDSEYGVCVASYETCRMSWDIIRMIPWDLVVLDESHMIKESRTERWKTVVQLRNISKERVLLTGTPICNTVCDLYGQLEFLGEGMSGFTSRAKFKEFYAVLERSQDGQHEKIVGYQNLPFLQERLARLAFMIKKSEALPDLPEKLYDAREIELTASQIEAYNALMNQLALEIEEGGKRMTAQHILVKLLRLAQITSGFLAWDPKMDEETGDIISARQIEYFTPNPKLDAFIEYVKESADYEKIICWACFIPDVKAIAARLEAEGIPCVTFTGGTNDKDRAEAERRFNCTHAKECKVFIGNPAAGGTGLNLRGYDPRSDKPDVTILSADGNDQHLVLDRDTFEYGPCVKDHGCDCTRVAYYSQGWSMVHRNQSEDRAHRRGTRRPVQYTDFVVPNTIDMIIRERVMKKTLNALTIQDVREIMKQVLSSAPKEDK